MPVLCLNRPVVDNISAQMQKKFSAGALIVYWEKVRANAGYYQIFYILCFFRHRFVCSGVEYPL